MDLTAPDNWSSVEGSFTYENDVWIVQANGWPGSGDFSYSGSDIGASCEVTVEFELFNDIGFWFEWSIKLSTTAEDQGALADITNRAYDPSSLYELGTKYTFTFRSYASEGFFKGFIAFPRYPGMIIHSITAVELPVPTDIMPDTFLDLEGSGMVDAGYYFPFTLVAPLSDAQVVDDFLTLPASYFGNYGSINGLIQLKLKTAATTNVLILESNNDAASVMIVSPEGTSLGLYQMSYGDIARAATTNEYLDYNGTSTRFFTSLWELPSDFIVETIILGAGGGGYPQEIPTIVKSVTLAGVAGLVEIPFWTNFNGQWESK